jgi:hypothetical protein
VIKETADFSFIFRFLEWKSNVYGAGVSVHIPITSGVHSCTTKHFVGGNKQVNFIPKLISVFIEPSDWVAERKTSERNPTQQ